MFATAIYTGLRKPDVDLGVARSYDRDSTKGGHADVIPIAAERWQARRRRKGSR